MKKEDFEIEAIRDSNGGPWCVSLKNPTLKGLIVQVDNIEDAPKQLAISFRAMLEYGLKSGNIEYREIDFHAK